MNIIQASIVAMKESLPPLRIFATSCILFISEAISLGSGTISGVDWFFFAACFRFPFMILRSLVPFVPEAEVLGPAVDDEDAKDLSSWEICTSLKTFRFKFCGEVPPSIWAEFDAWSFFVVSGLLQWIILKKYWKQTFLKKLLDQYFIQKEFFV